MFMVMDLWAQSRLLDLGGMNVPLSGHLAVRAFEADWLRTQLPNGSTGMQNSLHVGAGFIFKF